MSRWCLVVLFLVATCLAARSGARKSSAPAPPAAEASWPLEVQGFGRTVDAAKNDAAKYLVAKMTALLAEQRPPLASWRPSIEFVKRQVIQGEGMPGEDVELENVGRAKSWLYPVKALDWALLTGLDQEAQRGHRRQERINLATRLFAGLTLLLALAAFYFRVGRRRAARGITDARLNDAVSFSRPLR
jgi:hypothetical protein